MNERMEQTLHDWDTATQAGDQEAMDEARTHLASEMNLSPAPGTLARTWADASDALDKALRDARTRDDQGQVANAIRSGLGLRPEQIETLRRGPPGPAALTRWQGRREPAPVLWRASGNDDATPRDVLVSPANRNHNPDA